MSEEEKEAIKETKQVIEKWNDTNWLISYDHKNLEILLNLIDKLQKENEELQDIKNKAIEYIEENSFEDTTGVVLNLKDESYWNLWKILKGE